MTPPISRIVDHLITKNYLVRNVSDLDRRSFKVSLSEEGKKIVQEWYFGELEEPSIVTIKLHPNNNKTSVELIHTNIPDEAYNDIISGWDNDYFGALVDFFTDEPD